MYDDATIGARLRILRNWRRLTQQELAGLAGLSQGFVSLAERGERTLDRRSHIAALASALRVSETELVGGPHLSADPLQSDPHMAIPAIRMALQTNTLTSPAVERARPVPELAAEMVRIERSSLQAYFGFTSWRLSSASRSTSFTTSGPTIGVISRLVGRREDGFRCVGSTAQVGGQ
jgi:transcriptional regulator with XRE-family HTH domain